MKANGYLIILIIGLLVITHLLMYKWGSKETGIKEFRAGYTQCGIDHPVPSISAPDTVKTIVLIDNSYHGVEIPAIVTPADSAYVIDYSKAVYDSTNQGDDFTVYNHFEFFPMTKTWDINQKVSIEKETETIHTNTQLPTPPAPPAQIITKPNWWLCAASAIISAELVLYLMK